MLDYALKNDVATVLVTGVPGTGKSLLINDFLSSLDSRIYLLAVLSSTQLQAGDLLRFLAAEFGIDADGDIEDLRKRLEIYLIEQAVKGRKALLVIDEAHLLRQDLLEEAAPFCSMKFEGRPLLQLFCFGRDELRDHFFGEGGSPFSQENIIAAHLEPMAKEETRQYIIHRLTVAGWTTSNPEIDPAVFSLVHSVTGGVPRLVNHLMSRLLLFGRIEGRHQLGEEDIRTVIEEVRNEGMLSMVSEPLAAQEMEQGDVSLPEEREGAAEPFRHSARDVRRPPAPGPITAPVEPGDGGARPRGPVMPPSATPDRAAPAGIEAPAEEDKPPAPRRGGYLLVGVLAVLAIVLFGLSRVPGFWGQDRKATPPVAKEETATPPSPPKKPAAPDSTLPGGPRLAQRDRASGNATDNANDRRVEKQPPFVEETSTAHPGVVGAKSRPGNSDAGAKPSPPESTKGSEEVEPSPMAEKTGEGLGGPVIAAHRAGGAPQGAAGKEERTSGAEPVGRTATGVKALPSPSASELETRPVATAHARKADTVPEGREVADEGVVGMARDTAVQEKGRERPDSAVIGERTGPTTGGLPPLRPETREQGRLTRPPVGGSSRSVTETPVAPKNALKPDAVAQNRTHEGGEKKKRPATGRRSPVGKKDAVRKKRDLTSRRRRNKKNTGTEARHTPRKKAGTPKARLLAGVWLSRGKPATLLPSGVNVCIDKGTTVDCMSAEQTTTTRHGKVAYKVHSVLSGFTPDGGFHVDYRTMVALLDEDKVGEREWQISNHHMACRLVGRGVVRCRDDKNSVREYRSR